MTGRLDLPWSGGHIKTDRPNEARRAMSDNPDDGWFIIPLSARVSHASHDGTSSARRGKPARGAFAPYLIDVTPLWCIPSRSQSGNTLTVSRARSACMHVGLRMLPRPGIKRGTFLSACAIIAAGTITLAAFVWLVMGPAWFNFYGWAMVVLCGVIPLSWALWSRSRSRALPVWPIFVFAIPTVLACLVQIGFWAAFFSGGSGAIPLGLGRAMLLPYLDVGLIVGSIAMAALGTWLIVRAGRPLTVQRCDVTQTVKPVPVQDFGMARGVPAQMHG